MNKSKVLVALVLVNYLLSAIFGFVGYEDIAYTLDSLILPIVAIIYFSFFKKKTVFFSLFLLCYAGSDIIGLVISNLPDRLLSSTIYALDYYGGNSLYILAYVFLLIEICKRLNMVHVLKNFIIHVVVLLALSIWLVYVLQSIVVPKLSEGGQFYLELTYNIVMLVLLSGALLNYFYRDNQKALYLFLGALCIVFSEVINVAYIYISQRALLNFLSTTLLLSAFFFFCKQIGLSDEKEEEIQVALD